MGTFASAAGGGYSEQKGVAAVEKNQVRHAYTPIFSGTATGHNGAPRFEQQLNTVSLFSGLTHTETYRSGHNGADSKSVCAKAHVGSNPTVSARKKHLLAQVLFSTKSVLTDGINPTYVG